MNNSPLLTELVQTPKAVYVRVSGTNKFVPANPADLLGEEREKARKGEDRGGKKEGWR